MSTLEWYAGYRSNGNLTGEAVWKTEAQDYGGSVNVIVLDSEGNRRQRILKIVENNSSENMGDITIQNVNGKDTNYAILELRLNPPGYAKYTDFLEWLAVR
jgi:hypothetical protein